MLKTKSILPIMLVSILVTTLTVPMVPIVSAANYTLTIHDAWCQCPSWMPCVVGGTGGASDINFWWEGTTPAHRRGPTAVPIADLAESTTYTVYIPRVIDCACGGKCRAKTRWNILTANADLDITFVRPTKAEGPAGVWTQVYEYNIHNPVGGVGDTEIQPTYGRAGPMIDKQRRKVIKSPDAQLIAMQNEEGHVLTDLIRPGDIEKLDSDGFTITSAPGFHMGHIGYNIRPDQSYKNITNPDAAYVLSDVNFRHALFHTYNQEEIVSSIYGYTVTPVQSLVPPAQGGWVNPEVPLHPYAPGDKTGTTIYNPVTHENEDAASILRYGGYIYDAGVDNWVTPYDIDGDGTPGTDGGAPATITDIDDVVPPMVMWTPTYEVAPTSAEHGARFAADLHANGITSITHFPREFSPYTSDVFDKGDFDIYMVFWSLGRFPDHLYTMTHSDHDVVKVPGDYNAPGCNDPELDDAVYTIISSLDPAEKLAAAYKAQNILYNESYPNAAFSYMQLYSRIYFNAFHPDLRGIVNSPGYGSDNMWTHLNKHWAKGKERLTPEGKTIITWITGEEPELLNPLSADTVYAWDIIGETLDGLIAVNPYTHEDIPWLALDWDLTEWPNQGPGNDETWMNVTFTLDPHATWQDGNPYIAEDAKFNWLFLRDNKIPRYKGMWQFLQDVDVLDDYTVRATLNTTSQFLLYDLAGTAALLPPPVWSWLDGKPLNVLMEYDPSTNTTKPNGAGDWFGAGQGFPGTQLYGTGANVFELYDPVAMYSDFNRFYGYFKITEDLQNQKVEMFHDIGDINRDGYIDVWDLALLGAAYGQFSWMPGYNPDADLNSDGVIDGRDLALLTWHWGEQRSYPVPHEPDP